MRMAGGAGLIILDILFDNFPPEAGPAALAKAPTSYLTRLSALHPWHFLRVKEGLGKAGRQHPFQ